MLRKTMKFDSRRFRSRRSGTSLVELALTLGILFSITYGTIEFGYYFFVSNSMQGAAREGCRAGIVAGATNSSVTTEIEIYLQDCGLVPSGTTASGSGGTYSVGNYTVVLSPVNVTTATVGNTLTVTITATWGTVGAGFRPMAIIGASKTVTAATSMRIEG
jgi:Flp pilus assembly protein TadG